MKYQYNDGGRAESGFKGETSDCVVRAIAIATPAHYKAVYLELDWMIRAMRQTKKVRKSHPRTGINRRVYEKYLQERGWEWTPTMKVGQGCKTHLKAEELPKGNIIVRLSRHLAAVIDGVVHDTYDPSRGETRCVYGYYKQKQAVETPAV